MESDLLGEQILIVFERKHLNEAERAHPELVVYFPAEIEELRRRRGAPGFARLVKTVHAVKKHIGGWILPSGGQRCMQ